MDAGKRDIVRLLLDRGAAPGRPEAAFNGDLALVRLLLDSGADRSLRTGAEQTALRIAGERGQHEVARLLSG